MSSWSRGRQFSYFFTVLAVVAGAAFTTAYLRRATPTCLDGVKNQDEAGIDCGGSCALVCRDRAADPIVSWALVFPVRNGYVDVAAHIVNPNTAFEAGLVPYRFLVYDAKDRLVAERTGITFLQAGETVILFEPLVEIKERTAVRTFLEVSPGREIVWKQLQVGRLPDLSFENPIITIDPTPMLTGVIKNNSPFVARDVLATATLADASGNVLAVSSTKIALLGALAAEPATFTWPRHFERPVATSMVYFHVARE